MVKLLDTVDEELEGEEVEEVVPGEVVQVMIVVVDESPSLGVVPHIILEVLLTDVELEVDTVDEELEDDEEEEVVPAEVVQVIIVVVDDSPSLGVVPHTIFVVLLTEVELELDVVISEVVL